MDNNNQKKSNKKNKKNKKKQANQAAQATSQVAEVLVKETTENTTVEIPVPKRICDTICS